MKVLFRANRADNNQTIEGLLMKEKTLEYSMSDEDGEWATSEWMHHNSYAIQFEGHKDHLESHIVVPETIEQLISDDECGQVWKLIKE